MIGDRCADAYDAAAGLLREHLLHGQLSHVDEPIQIGGQQRLKIFGRVLGKRFREEDSSVVYQGVDRAKRFTAVATIFSAVVARPMSPSTKASWSNAASRFCC